MSMELFTGDWQRMLVSSNPMHRPLKLPTRKALDRAESKALWNEARSVDKADFYTIGYEGRTTDELIATLVAAGVKTLLDIRYSPLSMYRPELICKGESSTPD
jgi:hypothetical protein